MYILHVLSIKWRDKLYFSFSIPTSGFPHFYYMIDTNLGLFLYGEVSVMCSCFDKANTFLGNNDYILDDVIMLQGFIGF